MAVYDYRCLGCDTVYEVQHPMGDVPPPCECGEDLIKLFNTVGVTFKGTGFYSTDKGK